MGKLIQFKPKAKPAPRELTDLDREVRDEVRAKYRAAKTDFNVRREGIQKLIGETNPLRVAHATEQHQADIATKRSNTKAIANRATGGGGRKGRVGDYPGHPFRGNQHKGGK